MSTTVTGKLENLGESAISSGSFVRFYLRGTAGNQPRVDGTAIIAPTLGAIYYFDMVPSALGVISGTLWSTRDATGLLGGDIEVGGVTTACWYGMVVFVNGKAGPETPIHAKNGATFDISNVTPITTTPVITAPTGDSTYARLDTGNQPFTGAITAPQINNVIYVDGVVTTLAAGLAKCPATTAGCHIVITQNITITAQAVFNQNQSPLQIDCLNPSGVNANAGGTTITYTPAAFNTSAIDAAIFVNNLSRFSLNNCNITQGNSVKGASCTLTNIVGNGSVATANYANCTFFKGQVVLIASNSNSGFNAPQTITGVTGTTSFTFANPTNATGTGGTAQAGVAGVFMKGVQGPSWNDVQIYNMTGPGMLFEDDPTPSSGEYGIFRNLQLRGNQAGAVLSQLWGVTGQSVSGNKFIGGAIAGNTAINVYTSGTASENSLDTVDTSDTTNLLTIINQFGDGVNACRGPNVISGTIESAGPSNQIGYKTYCTMGLFDTEGGLTGTTPTIVKPAGGGSYQMWKHGSFGADGFAGGTACPGANWQEINTPNLKLDCNSNLGLSAAPISGTQPSINFASAGGFLCNSGTCPAQVAGTGLLGNGAQANLGSAGNPWLTLWLGTAATNNFKFAPAATAAARIINIPDPLGTTSLPLTIASGTKALNTSGITTATCDGGVAATANGTLSTDTVDWSFNAAPTASNKYGAFLVVYAVPSANTVTFYTCNPSATTSTPTAMTVNFSVRRP